MFSVDEGSLLIVPLFVLLPVTRTEQEIKKGADTT